MPSPHRKNGGKSRLATATKINGQPRWWRRGWARWTAASALGLLGFLAFSAVYVSRNLEPVLRRSVIESLQARFHSPVELDHLDIAINNGVQVRGQGLRILRLATSPQLGAPRSVSPMLSVDSFSFTTSLHDLVLLRAHLARVQVDGMELHLPPDRSQLLPKPGPSNRLQVHLTVGEIDCAHTKLVLETANPGKEPLEFDIQNLQLTDTGTGRPMLYVADLINPKPVGAVHAFGHFGPWHGADPRATPLDGDYRFDDADLGTIHGIGGTLSSTGHFYGELGSISIDGTTETPDFSLDVSGHPVPLHTQFHAIVDGTNGDTTLAPVRATLLHSAFTAAGSVVRIKGQGHDIALDIDMPHGRIEDLLQMGMKTQPPVMRGAVTMKARLHIPPGKERVAQKLELAGRVQIQQVEFTNPHVQDRVDGLSLRAQGRPAEVKSVSSDGRAQVASQMAVDFSLAHALLTATSLDYDIPGAHVAMHGVYSMDGNIFEFKGHVRTDATASQMVTGWKSKLLRPFDPLFERDGAGLQLPIAVSGTTGDIHFGLAFHGTDESPQAMAAEMRTKRHAEHE
jgi:hypothetical protein